MLRRERGLLFTSWEVSEDFHPGDRRAREKGTKGNESSSPSPPFLPSSLSSSPPGGYVSGDPLLGPFLFNLLHSSPSLSRFFAVSYRLAQHPSTSFPAALQDMLATWIYLTKEKGFRPEDVTLVGDSAGAGAIWSLVCYLGVLSEEKGLEGERGLGLPGKVALFSVSLTQSLFSGHFLPSHCIFTQ